MFYCFEKLFLTFNKILNILILTKRKVTNKHLKFQKKLHSILN